MKKTHATKICSHVLRSAVLEQSILREITHTPLMHLSWLLELSSHCGNEKCTCSGKILHFKSLCYDLTEFLLRIFREFSRNIDKISWHFLNFHTKMDEFGEFWINLGSSLDRYSYYSTYLKYSKYSSTYFVKTYHILELQLFLLKSETLSHRVERRELLFYRNYSWNHLFSA